MFSGEGAVSADSCVVCSMGAVGSVILILFKCI